jgi:hypothetical protein
MTAIDILALLNQAGVLISTLSPILSRMNAEGRTELTAEEVASVRALALASEGRLEAATAGN